MAVKTKFDKGEYKSPTDIIRDIDFFVKNGVMTNKSMQKMGYVILYDDEKEKLTYTTTYEANHHYYGHTKWCTASDRMGRYDGWLYFLYYTLNSIDYTNVNDLKDAYLEGKLESEEASSTLFQYINKQNNKTYQLQVLKAGQVKQICDEEDQVKLLGELGMSNIVKDIMFQNVINSTKLTTQSIKKEIPYQLSKEDSIRQKKEIRRQKKYTEFKSYYDNKIKFIKESSNKIFNSNLLKNIDFVSNMVNNYFNFEANENLGEENKILDFENKLKAQGYINISQSVAFESGFCALLIKPCYGIMKVLNEDYNTENRFLNGLDYDPVDFLCDDEDMIFYNIADGKPTDFESAIVLLNAELTFGPITGFRIKKINRIINVLNFNTHDTILRGCQNKGKENEDAYLFHASYNALPNIIEYRVESKPYLFSFINGKTFDVSQHLPLDNESIKRTIYFWCGNDFVMICITPTLRFGLIMDTNFNIERIAKCAYVNYNSVSYVYILCDMNTNELFVVSNQGLYDTGKKTNGKECISFIFKGKRFEVTNLELGNELDVQTYSL